MGIIFLYEPEERQEKVLLLLLEWAKGRGMRKTVSFVHMKTNRSVRHSTIDENEEMENSR